MVLAPGASGSRTAPTGPLVCPGRSRRSRRGAGGIDGLGERICAGWSHAAPRILVEPGPGRARDTRSKTTDYQIIADAGFPRQDIPRANPPVRERHNQMNAMLKAADGTASLFIHPRCKTLLRGLETVKLKPGAQYVET